MRKPILVVMALALWSDWLFGQQIVGGLTVTGSLDSSGASATRPARLGSAPPVSSCTNGEMYFDTSATAGQNLYLCLSNAWTRAGSASGTANQIAYFNSANGVTSDSKITRDASGNTTFTGTVSAGNFQSGSAAFNAYTLQAGWRITVAYPESVTCTSGAVTLDGNHSVHHINLNNQASCSITISSGSLEQYVVVKLCQGSTTATTTLTWPLNVKGGMAAGGTVGQCAAQSMIFSDPTTTYYATSPGGGWY